MTRASKDQQVRDVVDGLGLGLLARGKESVVNDKITLEFALAHAWRAWPGASGYPSVAHYQAENNLYLGILQSVRRRQGTVHWIREQRVIWIENQFDWTPDETARIRGFTPFEKWTSFADLFLERYNELSSTKRL